MHVQKGKKTDYKTHCLLLHPKVAVNKSNTQESKSVNQTKIRLENIMAGTDPEINQWGWWLRFSLNITIATDLKKEGNWWSVDLACIVCETLIILLLGDLGACFPGKMLNFVPLETESGSQYDCNLWSCKAHGGWLAIPSTPWISLCMDLHTKIDTVNWYAEYLQKVGIKFQHIL